MSQISKCPKVTVVLSYLEALGDVSELRYESLLYSSSKRSYCKKIGMENFKSFIKQIHDVSSIKKVHKIIFKFIFVTGKLGFAEYGLGLLASEKAECQNAGPCFSLYNKDFVLFAISITTVITNTIF